MKCEIKVNELNHEDLVNLFSTAFYGNDSMSVDYNDEDYNAIPMEKREGSCFEDKLADIILSGGKIKVIDYEAEGEIYSLPEMQSYLDEKDNGVYEITLKHILNGCSTNEGGELAKELLIDEEGDLYTAWNLMQIICFGEVIYG